MSRRGVSPVHKTLSALAGLLLPSFLARPLLNALGHRLLPGSHFGLSWVWCDFIGLDREARIGHFNIVAVRRLLMREAAYFGRLNLVKGPLDVLLERQAAIGNANRILRAPIGMTVGSAQLRLGELAKITVKHHLDCTRTIEIGRFSTLAGLGSQVWTHGYIHDMDGPGRYRIDGRVVIENNVYIGSACLVSMGVRLAAGVVVGGGTTVSRSLTEPGLYVSGPLRSLPRPTDPSTRDDLTPIKDASLCEAVFAKRNP